MQRIIGMLVAVVIAASGTAFAQEAAKSGDARGDLVAVDAAAGVLTIKTTAGAETKATLSPSTEILLVEAGAKSLDGAERVSLSEVKIGDRVWARGDAGADGAIATRRLVVMSAQSIADRNREDARDWQRRGVIGEIKAIDAAAKVMTVETYRGERVAVEVADSTVLRHLREGATDLSNSDGVSFAEIQVGNQIAARGDRAPDGAVMKAETVLTGTFPRPTRGMVASVDAAKGEVQITTGPGQTMVLEIPSTALVRKLTPRPPAEQGAAPPQGEQAGAQQPAQTPGAPGAGARRGPGGFAFALGDRSTLEQRTTAIPLTEVAAGDFVFAVVEPGATATTARARVLVKFEIPADRRPTRGPGMQAPPPSMDMGGDDDLPF